MLESLEPPRVRAKPQGAGRSLLALLLFGASFGYVEAAVVVYLRPLYEPLHQRLYPSYQSDQLFPLLTAEQLEAAGPEPKQCLQVELGREAATLLMLVAAGLAVGRNFHQWFAGFVVAFGVWDIFYYAFLKLLLDWPGSLMDWDLLFLLPVPWAGPVLSPVIVSLSMIWAGALLLRKETTARPIRPSALDWSAIVAGGLIIIVAFCWDFRNLMQGGEPNPFNWPLFGAGEALGLTGFVHSLWKKHNGPGGKTA